MSTRSLIGVEDNGQVKFSYIHCDGYPEHMVPVLDRFETGDQLFEKVIKQGGGSFLDDNGTLENPYGDMDYDTVPLEEYISGKNYYGEYYKYLFIHGRKMCFGIDRADYEDEEWTDVLNELLPILNLDTINEYGGYDFK